MPKAIEMKIESFKEVFKKHYYNNDDIAIFVLERLEKELNSELKSIYPINLGTAEHKKFIGFTDNCLIVAYSKTIEVERTNYTTEEKYIDEDRIIVIDKIPKNHIRSIELIEHGTSGAIYGGHLELSINLDIECDGETAIYLSSKRDSKIIHNRFELDPYTLIDTIELFAKDLI